MRLRRVSWPALALLAGTVSLAGCGGGSHKQTSTANGSAHSATKTASTSTTAAVKGLATVDDYDTWGSSGPDHLRVTIYDLRRSGPFVVLDFGVVCVQPVSGSSECTGKYDFTPSAQQGHAPVGASSYRSGGVYLIDPGANKEYRPVTNSLRRPQTSLLPSEIPVSSTPTLAWAKFPAPSASAKALDVVFPNGGPQIPSVPISATQAPTPSGAAAAQPAPGVQPADSTDPTGLNMPVIDLVSTVGNPNGSESETPGRSTITLRSDVLFHFDKSNLTPKARTILSGVAARIKARATGTVAVTGYTDSIGTDAVNIPLSQARAASVVAALKPQVAGAKVGFHAAGLGSADPVAPNTKPDGSDNPAGRALNRRVTISFAAKTLAPPTPPPAPPSPQQPTAPTSPTASFTIPSAVPSIGASNYRVTVNRLSRSGAAAVLQLTVACVGTAVSSGTGCDSGFDFAGSPTVPPLPLTQSNEALPSIRTASGFYLTDPATGTEYVPLYDTGGIPLTSAVPDPLPVGSSTPVWIYYPAPPASVTSMTVTLLDHRMRIGGVQVTG